MRTAVVGVGHLGRIHARILAELPGVELVGVADPIEANRLEAAALHQTRAYADYRELIGKIDAAVIATPTRFHCQVARELLAAGVHLLVEKPLATNTTEAAEMVAAARRSGVVLQVGHVERFNPAFLAAAPHLREPKYIEAVRRGGFSFRSTDIGVVLDLMVHDIDLVLSLVQSPVRRVDALGVALFGRHEDLVNARLTFANGCVATLSASRASHTAARTMHVWTRRGFTALDFAARTASMVRPSETILRHELDVEHLPPDEKSQLKDCLLTNHLPLEALAVPSADPLTAELTEFVAAVRTGRAPQVSGQQGLDAVAVSERILEQVEMHAWDGTPTGPVGPRPAAAPQILRGPHWNWKTAPAPIPRREAG
ncbi:MAG TPA: Gfo/Idh/MocA family oxidoreductase [Pirellulales bacterium]|nr:Gfo/Idh/MocA family oxidoreductase [Pirellulales bacterium]